ncbi:MAG TPA: pilus assembly PilX N-terminal domain-containing protein, partial [Clostridia bacterium]|nr:pilus assembly PilX N-terminal domain-containing protein [Clostridia bacterium]
MKGRFFSQHPASPSRARAGQSGVALVITLILLSVITFMAIAFLVLSRGERSSVATVTDEAVARLAADNALEQAKVQLIGPMMTGDNPFNFDLLVSTNYVNPLGFQVGPTIVQENVTNASYVYPNGTALSAAHSLQNLANLYFSPRPPVFVSTPLGNGVSTQDFRFYLDLNRNGRYDTNGFLPELAWDGSWIRNPTNGLPFTNFFVGDPEWIGGLEYPDRRHSRTNRFLYRYSYLVVPAGKTLDINYIHNAAKEVVSGGRTHDFFRNQGV